MELPNLAEGKGTITIDLENIVLPDILFPRK